MSFDKRTRNGLWTTSWINGITPTAIKHTFVARLKYYYCSVYKCVNMCSFGLYIAIFIQRIALDINFLSYTSVYMNRSHHKYTSALCQLYHTLFQSLILYTYPIMITYTCLPVSPVRLTVAILPILQYYLYSDKMFSIVSYWSNFTLAFKNNENVSSAYICLPETLLGFFRRSENDGERRAGLRVALTYNTTSDYLPPLTLHYFIIIIIIIIIS